MTDTAAPVPLDEQIAEVEREIRLRARLYPKWIEAKRLTEPVAAKKLAALRAAQTTLIWLDRNMAWIKPEAERRVADKKRVAASTDPTVAAVLDAFPGAEVSSVTDHAGARDEPLPDPEREMEAVE